MVERELRDRFHALQVIEDVHRTISLAAVRCLPFDELVERLKGVLTDSLASEVVWAVIESPRKNDQDAVLAEAIRELMQVAAKARSKERAWLDRQIGRILPALPPELSLPLARDLLADHRKGRRTAGFRALRHITLDEDMYTFLLRRLGETQDDRFAKALLSYPFQAGLVDPRMLLRVFEDDKYWRMRVVEAVLRAERSAGLQLARSYPIEFVWAAGRVGEEQLLPEICRCLERSNNKLELLGIVAWAYGKLGAYDKLVALQPLLDGVVRDYELTDRFQKIEATDC